MSSLVSPRALAAVVLLLAVGAAGFSGYHAHRADELADARTEALAAARERVPELLSYDDVTLEEDLADAVAQTTGDFASDYATILEDVVEPQARKRAISTRTEVGAAGVVSGAPDRVVVLLFLTQTTTTGKSGTSVAGSRVEVTMEHDGDEWKVAGLEPL